MCCINLKSESIIMHAVGSHKACFHRFKGYLFRELLSISSGVQEFSIKQEKTEN